MEQQLVFARLLARLANRSLPIRGTTLLAQEHSNAIGIAPIRRPGDERLQAIAFGRSWGGAEVLSLVDPNDRHDPALEPLAEFLNERLRDPRGVQLWVPDTASFAALAIEGQRSRTNPRFPPWRRQLGHCLHALARIHPLPGQQVVVIATQLLGEHLVTGLSPVEETHLGVRLAWDAPLPGVSPERLRALWRRQPGPSLMGLEDDERVEALRTRLRLGPAPFDRHDIAWHLQWRAEESWYLLVAAREVYCRLSLPPLPGRDELDTDSGRELTWLLEGAPEFGRHLGRTCAEFRKREFWRARLEDLNARGDPVWRELLRREGRVIAATTLRVRKRRLLLQTTQAPLRLRPGTRLTNADGRITAVVEAIQAHGGATWLSLRVTTGVRAAASLPASASVDWFDTVVFRGKSPRSLDGSWTAGIPPGTPLPPLPVPDDLLQLAMSLRQP